VASPEPAVGVFTPAGTRPGRLRRHYVIGYADPGQNPSAVRSGSSRVRGRGLGRPVVRSAHRCSRGSGDHDQGAEVPGAEPGREPRWEPHGRTTYRFSDSHEQRTRTRPRSRTVLNGSVRPRWYLRIRRFRTSSGDGPLSVRVRPSSLKRDCDRRTTSTGEKYLVNVHAKSRLTLEPLRTLRSETKGQAGACPDRTRAIPCTVQAITGRLQGEEVQSLVAGYTRDDLG
jgi:hypothetical protein